MTLHDATLTDLERLELQAVERTVTFEMDEETFRAFYDRTARPLRSYLARLTGESQLADDLLQESYYRFLRARVSWDGESHRRAYLYRIATNLVRDSQRRSKQAPVADVDVADLQASPSTTDPSSASDTRTDLRRAMARLRPRDRAMLWLAYGQGQAHTEIAQAIGVKPASIKLLLFRARRRLAALLHPAEGKP
jgi:RNA polymerase sigma-70 factor (ECF subfamily)